MGCGLYYVLRTGRTCASACVLVVYGALFCVGACARVAVIAVRSEDVTLYAMRRVGCMVAVWMTTTLVRRARWRLQDTCQHR